MTGQLENTLPAGMHWLEGERLFGQRIWVAAITLPGHLVLSDGSCASKTTRKLLSATPDPVTISLSHGPSFNSSDDLAPAAGAKILLHGEDRGNRWLGRNTRHCHFWDGERHRIADHVEVIHTGGHSPGHAVLHVALGGGYLFLGDLVTVTATGSVRWESGVAQQLRDPGYAVYLRKQLMSVDYDKAVSLHGGVIADARTLFLQMFEASHA